MEKITREKALKKIEELRKFVVSENQEFVKIDYSVIPKELFEKYGIMPFEIQKRKMRNEDGKVWNNINYFDAQAEAKKLGYRLPNLKEMLMLLEFYKSSKKEVISKEDKEFLGIEELSYSEDVCYEWVYFMDNITFKRGGTWDYTSYAGVFALNLSLSPANSYTSIGFRCSR